MDGRIRKTKEKLHNSLIELLKQKPLIDISVTALCKDAGIDRNTFYSHYSNTSEVLAEILDGYKREALENIRKNLPNFDFEKMLLETCLLIYKYRDLSGLLYNDSLGTHYLFELINRCNETCLPIFIQQNPAADLEKLTFANRFATGGATILLLDWCKNGMQESPEEISKKISELSRRLLLESLRG